MGIVDGKSVVITGAARGIGRAHALAFAYEGARVVVNDLGCEVDGTGSSIGPAGEVVDEIRAMGGEAVANGDDVADWEGAQRLVNTAVETFGGLDVLVCNAGILRDRMLVNMTAEEWDAVMHVHLRGTFAPSRWAAAYWREQVKTTGGPVSGRIICTTSGSGLFGNPGQANYGAAKAGIAAFAVIAAIELGRYGVTVNAVGPGALTRMTENLLAGFEQAATGPVADDRAGFSGAAVGGPEHVSPLVVWLASDEAAGVTGQVFQAMRGRIERLEGWSVLDVAAKDDIWEPAEVGHQVREWFEARPPRPLGVLGAGRSATEKATTKTTGKAARKQGGKR